MISPMFSYQNADTGKEEFVPAHRVIRVLQGTLGATIEIDIGQTSITIETDENVERLVSRWTNLRTSELILGSK